MGVREGGGRARGRRTLRLLAGATSTANSRSISPRRRRDVLDLLGLHERRLKLYGVTTRSDRPLRFRSPNDYEVMLADRRRGARHWKFLVESTRDWESFTAANSSAWPR